MACNIKSSSPTFSTCIEIFTAQQIRTAENDHHQMGREKAEVCNQTFYCDSRFLFLSYVVSICYAPNFLHTLHLFTDNYCSPFQGNINLNY